MSSQNLELRLVIKSNDEASATIKRVSKALKEGMDGAQRSSASLLDTMRRFSNVTAPVGMINGLRAISEHGARALRVMNALSETVGKVAAGFIAAKYVVSEPVGKTMDYGMRLAHMANTAFSDRDVVGRMRGKRELDAAIVSAVRQGGGTREGAAGALSDLIASGAMSPQESMGALPGLVRASTAADADPNLMANLIIRAKQTFKIRPDEFPDVYDMGITGGNEGGFELRDMSKWLPQQMAYATTLGMSGKAGLAKLIAANQAAVVTAGTKDEAGNNLLNLLAKANSQDTARDARKLGIDLPGRLAKDRAKGMDGLDSFVGIVKEQVGKDRNFQALQAKLRTATGDERKSILTSQADILQGTAIGKIIQDRQAMLALLGIMGNEQYMHDVERKVLGGTGAAERNFAVVSGEAGFKVEQAQNESVFSTQTAFERLTPWIGRVADGMAEHARAYPELAAAINLTKTALTALVAAIGAAGIFGMVTRGGAAGAATAAGAGLISSLAVPAAFAGALPLGALAALGGGGGAVGAYGLGVIGGGVAAAGGVGYGLGTLANFAINSLDEHFGTSVGESIGRAVAEALAKLGVSGAKEALKIELEMKNGNLIATMNDQARSDTLRR